MVQISRPKVSQDLKSVSTWWFLMPIWIGIQYYFINLIHNTPINKHEIYLLQNNYFTTKFMCTTKIFFNKYNSFLEIRLDRKP